MHTLKACLLNRRIFLTLCKYEFHTDLSLCGRKIKFGRKLSFNKVNEEFLNDDPEGLENFNEDDSELENLDFMKTDLAYDSHVRERKRRKDRIGKIMTMNKFFSPGVQPMMLTHNEKMCIKYLHNKDPVQWNINVLSESFPALPETIRKILKSNWKASEEKIQQIDVKVRENWNLLKEGKLDARPELIEHLKKFVNRREILLEDIKSSDFYLPEVKTKKVWNHGEMSKILKSYETSIEKLGKTNLNKHDVKLISDGVRNKVEEGKKPSQESTINHKGFNKSNEKFKFEEKESFTTEKMLRQFANGTIEQESINLSFKKINEKNQNSKAILHHQLNDESKTNLISWKNNSENDYKSNGKESVPSKRQFNKLPKEFLNKETTVVIDGEQPEADRNTEATLKNFKNELFNSQDQASNLIVDEKTISISEYKLGKVLNKEVESGEPAAEKKSKSVLRFEKLVENDEERLKKDNIYFEKIVNEIKNTPFWNNDKIAKSKPMIEFEKKTIRDPESVDKVTKMDLCITDSYPEKIIIPKEKRASGLLYKVNDCYYDDDGEFLYRVPGMIK